MKILTGIAIGIIVSLSFPAEAQKAVIDPSLVAREKLPVKLWYAQPAGSSVQDVKNGWQNDAEWLKALPVGNGFLGAMVFGDVNRERLQLNEKSVWSGSLSWHSLSD